MANPQRGEMEVEIGGQTYTLVPNHLALAWLEQRVGFGAQKVALIFARGDYGAREIVGLIYAGLVGAGVKTLTYEQVFEALFNAGLSQYAAPAMKLLRWLINGADVMEKELATEKALADAAAQPAKEVTPGES